MKIETAACMLDALGNPTRLRIFHILAQAGTEGLPVGALVTAIGMPGSTLSHHVAKLTKAGLVKQERRATTLFCHADDQAIAMLAAYLVGMHTTQR
jgi:ArsR family transcriptional regulator, arsenate/arsenite/antimonite-responsive transcriptional repressor